MEIKEYISSGVVEMYTMDALSPQEKAEFEQKLLLYPELKKELLSVQNAMEGYAKSHAVNPRPELRAQILEAIDAAPAEKKKKGKAKVIHIGENTSITYKYMVAACLAALVVSTFASWFFYTKWNDAEDRYTSLLTDKNQLAVNYNMVKMQYDQSTADMIIMRDADMKVVQLNAMDTSMNYEARVYWNNNTKEAYIDVLALPAVPSNKQFQLWALVDGKPVDAGVFELGEMGMQKVKDIDRADAWAVTLEPKGGSVVPTLTEMYLMGKSS